MDFIMEAYKNLSAFVSLIGTICFLVIFVLPKSGYAFGAVNVASNTFIFNPRTHSYKAINSKGKVVKKGRASGGKSYCRDTGRRCYTPVGSFRVQRIQGASCYSHRYRSKMPYCMFFSKYYAVHGHHSVPNYNASHGCIRVPIPDARWLYKHFMRHGTKVIVKPY